MSLDGVRISTYGIYLGIYPVSSLPHSLVKSVKATNRLITLVGFALSSPPPVAGGAEVTVLHDIECVVSGTWNNTCQVK